MTAPVNRWSVLLSGIHSKGSARPIARARRVVVCKVRVFSTAPRDVPKEQFATTTIFACQRAQARINANLARFARGTADENRTSKIVQLAAAAAFL